MIVLAALAGLAAMTFTVALAGLHRLSAHVDVSAVPGWFWYFRNDPGVQRWFKVGAISSLATGLLGAAAAAKGLQRPLYGAARWAREHELRQAGFRAKSGILLGRAGGQPLVFGGQEHVLLYAPTRSGKGVGVVIPNLLTWPHSTVVLDVKRENWEATAGYRAAHGQQVLLFDPLDPEGRTARFNPLGHVDRRDPVAVLDELQKVAVMLLPAPPHTDPFWAEAARTGFIGVGALVAATPDKPFSMGAIYAELTEGDPRTRLRQIVRRRNTQGEPLSPGAASALSDFCSTSENTFASVKQTLTSRMSLWLNPRIRAATEVSDFDLRDFRSRRISLYLGVSPDNLSRVAPLYNLLFSQLIDLNTRERPSGDQHAVPVLVLLDEFARLGHASVLAHAFAYVAGYGLRLLPVLQSPAQLRAEYGPDLTDEIISNCGAELVFAPKELRVARDLSERLGFQTVPGRSRSRPSGLSHGNRSVSESDQRRALMLPQELLGMPPDRLIALHSGVPPIRGRKIAYYEEPAFQARLLPPPQIQPRPVADAPSAVTADDADTLDVPMDLDRIGAAVITQGLAPLPERGASEAEVKAWVEQFIDGAAPTPVREPSHGR